MREREGEMDTEVCKLGITRSAGSASASSCVSRLSVEGNKTIPIPP